jgi:DNA-binding XRE family transcriptional regulator
VCLQEPESYTVATSEAVVLEANDPLPSGDDVAARPTLTEVRLRAALSMNELARDAGVSASTVLDIERGATPRMATIRKLAKALGIAPQDIAWPGDPFSALDLSAGEQSG